MATQVILKETIESLGIIGSEVKVADGYARNYLLPQGKAVLATPQNRRVIEQARAKFEQQIAKETAAAEQLAKILETIVITVEGKVSDEDNLYGSVTAREILAPLNAALAEKSETAKIEKRMLLLKEPIKKLGTYKVTVRVYTNVEPEITVEVLAAAKN